MSELFRAPFEKHLFFDGAIGTMLQQSGLKPGELPENWNVCHGDVIENIHLSYLKAGASVITANTFGANALKYTDEGAYSLDTVISAAIAHAKRAIRAFGGEALIALDIGPLGRLLKPYGDLEFDKAVSIFAQTVRLGVQYGADLILIETMNDSLETKAAVLAAKENGDLPIIVTNTYDKTGKLMTGADAGAMVAMLEGLRVDALGVNCGDGPEALLPTVRKLAALSSLPILACPNAGLPETKNGKLVYSLGAADFAEQMEQIAQAGATFLGGCCGTTPEYIAAMVRKLSGHTPRPITTKNDTLVSSYTHAVRIGGAPVIIGERINPTGKPKLKKALRAHDLNYILNEGLAQQENGAHMLDVNVGLPEIDECAMLAEAVSALQGVLDLPLQLDTANPAALEAAMRAYNGKPLVNSVNGKQESMDAVFPLVQKYGGVIVALTLDEAGIPDTARGRVEIALRIIEEAKKYGIDKKDILVDPLAMAVSAQPDAALITLETLKILRDEIVVCTSLGVSNVSFGLPGREMLGAAFFALALENGLSAAIINPAALDFKKIYHSFLVLHHMDENCAAYIDFAQSVPASTAIKEKPKSGASDTHAQSALSAAIAKGLADQAFQEAQRLLAAITPLDVIDQHIIPALNQVGKAFEKKTLFLPQLLMSAEAAGHAFDAVKAAMPADAQAKKMPVVLATVKGDIHDIGKNIVRVLLENYGYAVLDLGRDVDPEVVVDAVLKCRAPLCGLSALMTTTVPAMQETVHLVHQKAPWCKVVVGGAVLTLETAQMMQADHYAKDAMETVRFAEQIFAQLHE